MSTTEDVLAVEAKQFEAVPAVTSQAEYESAAGDRMLAKQYIKRAKEFCAPTIEAGHAAWQAGLAMRERLTLAAETFVMKVDASMERYVLDEQRKKREAEESARIEAKRIEDERLAMAAKAEAENRPEEAAVLMETALAPPAPKPVLVAPPRATGTAATVRWKGRVSDLQALCRAIGEGSVPAHMVTVDEGALNRAADSIANSQAWPGVEWYETAQFRSRSS